MGAEGFRNENDICGYLNEKRVIDINENMKKFLNFLYEMSLKNDQIIFCEDVNRKADIKISINKKEFYVSIKNSGSGHSVHQEKLDFFIKECMESRDATNEEIKQVKNFIDETVDGQIILDRNRKMQEVIQNFLDKNQKFLLERFLRKGRNMDGFADYVYFGTINSGKFGKIDDIISWMINMPIVRQKNVLYVGHLTFQTWNRINEDKRHVVQVKFGALSQVLGRICE